MPIVMEPKKIIIGLVGEAGSGKDTVANYIIEKHRAASFRFADLLREALEIFFGKGNVSREQLIWLSNSIRGKYGNDVIAKALRKRIDDVSGGIVILNGMRIGEDVDFVRSFQGSVIIYVTLDQKSRWERIYGRGEKSDDAMNFEKFQEIEKAETEVQIPEIGKKADFRLINNETKDNLCKKTEEIIEKIMKG
jgi:dephospho-CoA kinase